MRDNELAKSLVESIGSSELSGIAAMGLDALVNSGVSVFGNLRSLFSLSDNITNYLYARKLEEFFRGVSDIPKEERQKQCAKLLVSEKERIRVGEFLLLLLDKLDDIAKAELVSKVFVAYLRERISQDEMRLMARAINLLDIKHLQGGLGKDFDTMQALAMCGLARIEVGDSPPKNPPGMGLDGIEAIIVYKVNALGETLASILSE